MSARRRFPAFFGCPKAAFRLVVPAFSGVFRRFPAFSGVFRRFSFLRKAAFQLAQQARSSRAQGVGLSSCDGTCGGARHSGRSTYDNLRGRRRLCCLAFLGTATVRRLTLKALFRPCKTLRLPANLHTLGGEGGGRKMVEFGGNCWNRCRALAAVH